MGVMKATRVTGMTGVIVAVLVLAGGSAARARPEMPLTGSPPGPCALARTSGETVRTYSARIIRCAAGTWTVPGGAHRAICIARRESGLIPTASSANGEYLGLFQHRATYWPSRYDAWTKVAWDLNRSALDARTNAIVTIRMVHAFGRWVTAGWPVEGC